MSKTMLDKSTSDRLIQFYGNRAAAEAKLKDYNKGIIVVCPNCHKVDIDVIKHPDNCSPSNEQRRQEAQDVYWK